MQDSLRKWNHKTYWNPQWNRDITFPQAFQASCVWYYRRLIDEVGEMRTKHYLQKFNYGNMDTSDWKGLLNSNTNIPELRGFWLESSLKISPVEQTRILAEIFKKNSPAAADLQSVMKIQDSPVKIYGKTGMGVKNDKVVDAWFVGFYETADNKIFFAVRLDDNDNNTGYSHNCSCGAWHNGDTVSAVFNFPGRKRTTGIFGDCIYRTPSQMEKEHIAQYRRWNCILYAAGAVCLLQVTQ